MDARENGRPSFGFRKAAFCDAPGVLAGQTDTFASHPELNVPGFEVLFNRDYAGM
jgi:hypothetical protein